MEDLEIITRIRGGDSDAYAELVRRYESRVRGLCVSMLLDGTDAEDAAQEVFVKVFRSLSAYRQDASFGAWIYRVTTNHCLDLLRKKKRRKTDSLDQIMETPEGDEFSPREPRATAGEDPGSEQSSKREMAIRLLACLPPDQRALLMLREINGLRYDEIAGVLDCSVEAVRARLHRARHLLQQKARHFSQAEASDK